MCGISVLLRSLAVPGLPPWPFWAGITEKSTDRKNGILSRYDLLHQLTRRGPNSTLCESIALHPNCTIEFIQTVLSHRGKPPKSLRNPSENVFLYNGELYDQLAESQGDREAFLELLDQYCFEGRTFDTALLSKLDSFRGPWTFVFWHHEARRLYFARDVLGRRSLLLRVNAGHSLELVSVATRNECDGFVEVPTIGLAYIELNDHETASFGLIPREKTFVIPRRVENGGDEQIVSGSSKQMYVSFLPRHWLRSLPEWKPQTSVEASADEFLRLFRQSVRRRLITNRKHVIGSFRYAVLFSGGIDSLVMTAVLDECLPQNEGILLLNVAFGKDEEARQQCPDRVTALSGLKELQNMSKRLFELVCIDITPTVADTILGEKIRHLVHPCDQPMDASIGTAIWAAASANNFLSESEEYGTSLEGCDLSEGATNAFSKARILFSGLGADELMGGYKGRHRTIFRTEGTVGILREMDADLSRLWFRNLGRDDRLIADHGKEVRHPYLDEDLIDFVTSLPLVDHVCDLSKPDGIGDKHLLRRAAHTLGFSRGVTSRAKRAIQFGSRSKQVIERKRRD